MDTKANASHWLRCQHPSLEQVPRNHEWECTFISNDLFYLASSAHHHFRRLLTSRSFMLLTLLLHFGNLGASSLEDGKVLAGLLCGWSVCFLGSSFRRIPSLEGNCRLALAARAPWLYAFELNLRPRSAHVFRVATTREAGRSFLIGSFACCCGRVSGEERRNRSLNRCGLL